MMKWNYDIRIHYEVTENWMHTVSAAAMEGIGIQIQNKFLWHQRLRKNVKCYEYKQQWFYNAEPLCEEAGHLFVQ
jgi:hypothetical protein